MSAFNPIRPVPTKTSSIPRSCISSSFAIWIVDQCKAYQVFGGDVSSHLIVSDFSFGKHGGRCLRSRLYYREQVLNQVLLKAFVVPRAFGSVKVLSSSNKSDRTPVYCV